MSDISITNLDLEAELLDLDDIEILAIGGGYCQEVSPGSGIYICQEDNETYGGGQACVESETLQQSICIPL